MSDVNYLKAVIAVIEFIFNGHRFVLRRDGERLAGNYWVSVCNLFVSQKVGYEKGGDFYVDNERYLQPVYASYLNGIYQYERDERDRQLENKFKEENILYGKKGYKISVIAIILSSLSILPEIVRLILSLAQ